MEDLYKSLSKLWDLRRQLDYLIFFIHFLSVMCPFLIAYWERAHDIAIVGWFLLSKFMILPIISILSLLIFPDLHWWQWTPRWRVLNHTCYVINAFKLFNRETFMGACSWKFWCCNYFIFLNGDFVKYKDRNNQILYFFYLYDWTCR